MNLIDKFYKLHEVVGHFVGKLTKRYYFEDYVRVYPDGIVFDKFGRQYQPSQGNVNNFLNHFKFYKFAAQFVLDKIVADIGCGAGYGCAMLKQSGGKKLSGSDISKDAIRFAKSRYSHLADFNVQGITDLNLYDEDSFDITISSEVLEHIKEYGMETKAMLELKRITRRAGLIIIGTPNSEMLGDHGFSFDEIQNLFKSHFKEFCIFENALIPFENMEELWEARLAKDSVGVVVSEKINLDETCLPPQVIPKLKQGIKPGRFKFAGYEVDTTLLHNTHSWVVLAVNNK